MYQRIEPVIKWTGSKHRVAPILADLLPSAPRYFEPFVGSGAMLPFRPSKTAVAGDIIPELVQLWQLIRDEPAQVIKAYQQRWQRLQNEGHTIYYDIRRDFNSSRNPFDFLFLTRTCVNGLIRFNKNGDFNNSFHLTRPGIAPHRLDKLIQQWSVAIQQIDFVVSDYRQTLKEVKAGDARHAR